MMENCESRSLLVPTGCGANRVNPVVWGEAELLLPSLMLSSFCLCQPRASRIPSCRVPRWLKKSRGVTDTHRVCLPGWSSAYRSAGVSHFLWHSTSGTGETLSLFHEGWENGKTPSLLRLALPVPPLHKSSGFVQLLGQVWALALRRGVIPATCTQECALSDFPPGFSLSPVLQSKARSPLWAPHTKTSQGSISRVPVGFTGISPERVDPGMFPNSGYSLCLLDTKKFPSLDRGHPMSLREGTEMMTALPSSCSLRVENSTPSLHASKQGWKNYPGSSDMTRSPHKSIPPQDFCR